MAEKSFEFDTSKIVVGSISADKIVTGPQWDNYPTEPGGPDAEVSDENVWKNYGGIVGPKTQAMIQELSDYNVRMNDWIMKMASEPSPPPDTSWITFENLGERKSERRRKKPRNHEDNLQSDQPENALGRVRARWWKGNFHHFHR